MAKKEKTEKTEKATPTHTPTPAAKDIAAEITKAVKDIKDIKDTHNDVIMCRSVIKGGLYMNGQKSGITYQWTNEGDRTEVDKADILAAIRSHSDYITKPYFIIEDTALLERYPRLKTLYENLYSIKSLKDILKEPPQRMIAIIEKLPDGPKDSIKSLASEQIAAGTLDSIRRIKALDKYFGTKMLIKVAGEK